MIQEYASLEDLSYPQPAKGKNAKKPQGVLSTNVIRLLSTVLG